MKFALQCQECSQEHPEKETPLVNIVEKGVLLMYCPSHKTLVAAFTPGQLQALMSRVGEHAKRLEEKGNEEAVTG